MFNPFFLRVSFQGAGRRICRFLRVGGLLGIAGLVACEDAGGAGRGEDNFDGPVHDVGNSLVDGVAGNVLGDVDIVVLLLHDVGRMILWVIR